ncbi:RNA polymerase-binding transcription factor DksA [Buchnera aphidicola (Protaphis terricola)]|uniref:RNA polymerase-binding protein DksA n=1 Tax=Buchnera aphidicola TaxID=9 RepID=UPI003464E6EA
MTKKNQKKKSSLNVLSLAGLQPYQKKTNEQYMNKNQILHFKKILETWKNQLKFEIDHTLLYIQDKSTNFPDPIDRAAQEEEFSLELRNQDRSQKLIKKIEITLKKINNNDFGYCNSCGIEIGIRRLEARPTASLCIDCKTLAEIREKQMAG